MVKKLLLLSAFFMMCICGMSAQTKWYVVADGKTSVAVEDVAYLLFTDEAEDFSIVKNDGSIVAPVSEVSFSQNAAGAVEGISYGAVEVSVFPNPVVNYLNLKGLREDVKAQIYSLSGALLIEAELGQGNGNINVSDLSAGTYVLKVKETTVKFVKK